MEREKKSNKFLHLHKKKNFFFFFYSIGSVSYDWIEHTISELANPFCLFFAKGEGRGGREEQMRRRRIRRNKDS